MSAVGEKAEILERLATYRRGVRGVLDGLSDEDATKRTTASELCLGGIVKHVAYGEEIWIDFVVEGGKTDDLERYAASFRMEPGETVATLLERYASAARRTEEVVAALPDLDVAHPLPEAPWYPPDTSWSVRQVLLHILEETAHHLGHADIIRESMDVDGGHRG